MTVRDDYEGTGSYSYSFFHIYFYVLKEENGYRERIAIQKKSVYGMQKEGRAAGVIE